MSKIEEQLINFNAVIKSYYDNESSELKEIGAFEIFTRDNVFSKTFPSSSFHHQLNLLSLFVHEFHH
jgi:hypothetical protein